MSGGALPRVQLVVRTIAQTPVENETYVGDLDAVVGDDDVGYSLAPGSRRSSRGGTTSTAPTWVRSSRRPA